MSGEVKRPTPTTGLLRDALHPARERLLEPLVGEARSLRIHVPGGDVDVPQVRQVREHVHDLARLALVHAVDADEFLRREAHGDRALVADRFLRIGDELAQQAHAVFERAAVFVAAMIAPLLQEVHRERQVVRGVDVHDVEARTLGAQRRVAMPATIVADVAQRHRARLLRIAVLQRLMRRRDRDLARVQVRGCRAVVRELDRRERAVRVHFLAHQRERGNVVIVPEPRFDVRRDVAGRMDLAFLGADDRPAAFGFRRAHRRVRLRHGVTHAVAVRDLEEAVLRRYRADADRLEQDVVARIALHETLKTSLRRAAGAVRRRCHHFIRKYSGRPSANSPMPHQNASGPAPYSVHAEYSAASIATASNHASSPPLDAQIAAPRELECGERAEQVHHQIRGGRDQDDQREHLDHRAAVVHQHDDRDERAGDEQRVVGRAVARLVREQLGKHLLLRQHARHLALDEDPAVERAEAADECEQREQARCAVAPEQAHSVRERRVRSGELRAGNQQDHDGAGHDVDERSHHRAPQRRERNVALRVDDVVRRHGRGLEPEQTPQRERRRSRHRGDRERLRLDLDHRLRRPPRSARRRAR